MVELIKTEDRIVLFEFWKTQRHGDDADITLCRSLSEFVAARTRLSNSGDSRSRNIIKMMMRCKSKA